MRLLWLADVLRAAGLTVHEVSGWRTRGSDSYGPVRGLICHETRGSATSSDAGELGVLVNGREGLAGPIAQLYLSRTGAWHVVAAGRCNHVRTGWGGPFGGIGNSNLLGVEAQHAEAEDWAKKPAQYASYVRGVAAILRHTGWPPPAGHKEHQPGDKPDPEFSMVRFRGDVAAVLRGEVVDDMSVQSDQTIEAWRTGMPTAADGRPVEPVRWRIRDETWQQQVMQALTAIAARVDIDPGELDAIRAAAREGALSAADGLVAAVLAGLPEGDRITKADVEQAVRDAFAGGLAAPQA